MKGLIIILAFLSFFFSEVSSQNLIKYSINSDTLFCGKTVTFTKMNPSDTVSIYYSFDEGKTWNKISDNFHTTIDWQIPFTLNNKILIKTKQQKIQPMQLIWEVTDAHNGEIRAIDFSLDRKFVLTLGKDGLLKVWDIEKRRSIDSIKISGTEYYYDAKFLKDPNKVVFTLQDRIVLWNRQNKTTEIFYTIGNFIRKIDLNPINNNISIITDDINLAVFNETFFLPLPINLMQFSKNQYANAYDLKYSSDGKQVVVATYTGKLLVTNGNNELSYTVDNKPIYSATFTSNDLMAFGGASNQLGFYRINGNTTKVEPTFNMAIREVRFSKERNEVYAGSLDSTLRIWSAKDLSYIPYFLKEPFAIFTFDLTQSGDTLATAGRNNSFRIWKNYQNTGKEQIDTFTCLQEIFLSVNSDRDNISPREILKFNFVAESQFKDTLRKIGKWKIKSKISFPYQSLDSYIYEINLTNNKYVFELDTNLRFTSEAISEWSFRSLYNNEVIEKIEISELAISPKDNFYPVIVNNSIQVEYACQSQPMIGFEQKPMIQQVIKENDGIQIAFDSEVWRKYDIFVSDYLGRTIEFGENKSLKAIKLQNSDSRLLIINLRNNVLSITYKILIN